MTTQFPIYFGTFSYRSLSSGNVAECEFDDVEFPARSEAIKKVEINCPDGKVLSCRVHMNPTGSLRELYDLAKQQAQMTVNSISFHLLMDLTDPIQVDAEVYCQREEELQPARFIKPARVTLTTGSVRGVARYQPKQLNEKFLAAPECREDYLEQFRLILNRTSGVDRFMGFYQLLLQLLPDSNGNETQRNVDEFIRRWKGTSGDTPRPSSAQRGGKASSKRQDSYETRFTRLRNEYAHFRENVSIRTRNKEMESLSGDLMDLAIIAIREAKTIS